MASQAQPISDTDLWSRVRAISANAASHGALQPIQTVVRYVDQAGIRFIVRILDGAAGRAAAQQRLAQATIDRPSSENPFLPYDAALFVADLSPTHVCLLNKYPVVNHHLLIVTRAFEEQEALLSEADFEALLRCMHAIEGLAFYNSGKVAGASQRHKHLQLAPFPLDPAGIDVPIEAALDTPRRLGEVVQSPHLPFPHALVWSERERTGPDQLAERYRTMLRAIGVWQGDNVRPKPYNWLATRRWMLAVPRAHESIEGISINALGFAGSFLVKDEAQLAWLRSVGPLHTLQAVTGCEIDNCGAAPPAADAHEP